MVTCALSHGERTHPGEDTESSQGRGCSGNPPGGHCQEQRMVLRPTKAKGSGGFSNNFSQKKQFHLGAVYALIHLVNKH